MLNRSLRTLRNYGLAYSLQRVTHRVLRRPLREFPLIADRVTGKIGLEIGGPSPAFAHGGLIPLYEILGSLDNCNFSSVTLWSRHENGGAYQYAPDKPAGRQFLIEGADLAEIGAESYDILLSSHMLEHSANPLRALEGWRRVLKPGGALLLLLPNAAMTFDHRRPITRLEHLIADFEGKTLEDDLTHLAEVLEHHDLDRDPGAGGNRAVFRSRCERNFELRAMHHHVFDLALTEAMLRQARFEVDLLRTAHPDHIVALGRKTA